MPVIQVTAPRATDDPARDLARLTSLCAAVADALGLPPSGVVATLCEAVVTTTGDGPVTAWPLAVLHGSDRGEHATASALAAAARSLAEGWEVPPGEVWVTWVTGAPPARG
ncbi:hypothetical protein [Streptomyces sp. SID11385]|uniref:hypothetical protein n=1 Tax=Streptomyces sp. SID11385 TaxID=2706031 RepID=UPI0013CD0A43|nr:hypothetical protein [Streptomyces sp. SID11385]NEA42108.1 hypothetical protein [Streptomyces sp. SID11385]